MKNTINKLIFVVGVIAISSAIFVGGSMFGVSQNFMEGVINNSSMEKSLVEGVIAFNHIEKIDQGNIESAKESMNLFLDTQIVIINQLMVDSPNEKFKIRAKSFLSRIAKHRKIYPLSKRTIQTTQGGLNTNDVVQKILDISLE